ncbi:hypothetical protein LZ30DRAFT_786666 [Colletotrichum cereale]|nr:hypothetical protein LZ30DRAFT_786666 [Colletotrichum cereale]
MAKPPTPARCPRRLRRIHLRFRDALDNTYLLRQILKYRQKPFPPPGVPYLEDGPAWSEYLDRKTPAQKKKKKKKTKEPGPHLWHSPSLTRTRLAHLTSMPTP